MLEPVTPYVGVWIETGAMKAVRISCDVTPYVGVWIETITGTDSLLRLRHSLCGSVD